MITLLQLLWYGHMHKWKIIDQRGVTGKTDDGSIKMIGTRYTCQCEKCGTIKMFGE